MHFINIRNFITALKTQSLFSKAEKFFNEPVSQKIFEGCSINHYTSSPGFLMNSKAEFRQGEVARVVIVRGLGE